MDHRPANSGFDIPVDHLYASPVFFEDLKNRDPDNMTIFSPGVGGMKMASAYSDVLGCPLGFVAKRGRVLHCRSHELGR